MTARVINFTERLNARRTVERTFAGQRILGDPCGVPPIGKRVGDRVRHRLLKRDGYVQQYFVEESHSGWKLRLAVRLHECLHLFDPDEVDPIP